MPAKRRMFVFGASYGSLLANKLLAAAHGVTLVCRRATAEMIEREGIRVRMQETPGGELVEIDSRRLPGRLSAVAPSDVDANAYVLVVLAMQVPQYRAPDLRAALSNVAPARIPCMSIMNMPPLPFLARIDGIDVARLRSAYVDPGVWDEFDPTLVTLCSRDPQAYRPPGAPPNVLHVGLATNFKTAPFADPAHNALLNDLQADIEAARFPIGDRSLALPVKLKVHHSLCGSLAKWSMLLAGNY